MSYLNKFINWVLYTSLFAATCAVGLSMATERLINDHIPSVISFLHLLIFCSTLLVYNAHYLIKKAEPGVSDRFAWSQHYRLWHYLFLSVGLAGCIVSVFFLSFKVLVACGILAVLSFAYSLPMLPFKDKQRLKDFGWIKILVLTSVWTIVTSVLPILFWDKPLGAYPFEILLRFVFMFALCVAFDIRDMQTDMDANIYTLPNRIGLQNSYRLINLALELFIILSVIQYFRYPSLARLAGEIIAAVVTKFVIEYTKKHTSDRVYLGLVDGMMLLYAALMLLH